MGELEQDVVELLGYYEGYNAAIKDIKKREQRKAARAAKRSYERKYFLIQKAAGLLMLVISFLLVPALDYDATGLLITVPMGLVLLFTNKHLLQIMGHDGDEL